MNIEKPPLLFRSQFGRLSPVNKIAEEAVKALSGQDCRVEIKRSTANQRRRAFYWLFLDVVAEVLRDRTDTPWDAETLHDELRKTLRLYDGPPLKTPAGREVYRLKSTSDRSMNEVERAAWTTRAVNYCELITGVEARTLIDEVRARGGGEPEMRDAA